MERTPLVIVAGTRPELIKIWPVIKSLEEIGQDFLFIWTSQHYDYEMSKIVFNQLDLPEPDIYLSDKANFDSLSNELSFLVKSLARVLKS